MVWKSEKWEEANAAFLSRFLLSGVNDRIFCRGLRKQRRRHELLFYWRRRGACTHCRLRSADFAAFIITKRALFWTADFDFKIHRKSPGQCPENGLSSSLQNNVWSPGRLKVAPSNDYTRSRKISLQLSVVHLVSWRFELACRFKFICWFVRTQIWLSPGLLLSPLFQPSGSCSLRIRLWSIDRLIDWFRQYAGKNWKRIPLIFLKTFPLRIFLSLHYFQS